jgi:hypothetical protein
VEKTRAKQWMDFLGEEGYRPVMEDHEENPEWSRLKFKAEGKKCQAFVDEDDPSFAHVQLSYDLRDGRDLGVLARIANDINGSLKCAKATVDDDAATVRFNMEWFQDGLPSAQLFERALCQLAAAAAQFFEKLGAVEPVKALA